MSLEDPQSLEEACGYVRDHLAPMKSLWQWLQVHHYMNVYDLRSHFPDAPSNVFNAIVNVCVGT